MQKILFLLEDYNYFYTNESIKLLKQKKSYKQTLDDLINRKHYQSDSMANAFKALGHDTRILIPEANPLQLKWLKENNKGLYLKWLLQKPLRSYLSRVKKLYRNSYNTIQVEVLLAQVKEYKPDIIYFYSNIFVTEAQVLELKKHCKKVVLQWTCPIWREHPDFPYWAFDLIITAAIQLKEYFDSKKYKAVYIQQAFDDSIIQRLEPESKEYKGDVIFVGSFSLGHNYRFQVLELLLKNNVDLTIHGMGKEYLPEGSLVRSKMKEPLFGIDMYNEYRKYKMAIHIHTTGNDNDGIDWNKYAGAKRLFEITGTGTLLLTSYQENIKELFEIDQEVITYLTPNDVLQKINFLLRQPEKIKKIARQGMERTIKDHSFKKRALELSPALFN